jgi:3-oxoacyl-[acyl-carrier protein] reductase
MRVDLSGLNGKRVLITGASRGIGRATAVLAAEYETLVGINFSVQLSQAKLVKQMIDKRGERGFIYQADVSDYSGVQAMVSSAETDMGGIDILINNAGVGGSGEFLDEEIDRWREVVDVNLLGLINTTHVVGELMLEQARGGVIVNVASGAGKTGYPGLAVYSATKFAVLGFTEAIGRELYPDNIRVYAVCPGTTATDMTGGHGIDPEKVAERILATAVEQLGLRSGEETEIYR